MISVGTLLAFLEDTFKVSTFSDVSYNGLQFEGKNKIKNLVTGVDASTTFLKAAVREKADFAIVHHGLFWKGSEWRKIDRLSKEKIEILIRGQLNLYGLHLPLDSHPELGNNVRITMALGAVPDEPFHDFLGQKIGLLAHFERPISPAAFQEKIRKTVGPVIKHLNFGPSSIKRIGVVSGSGWSSITDHAVDEGKLDAILTGEILHQVYDSCKNQGIHMFSAGHYATETFGVKALGEMISQKFGLRHKFLDCPTGL